LIAVILVVAVTLAVVFISRTPRTEVADKVRVVVTILPQVDFVERIGGDKVQVSEMIPPGFSPATYDPSPEQLQKLQEAELYFRIGHVPFEKAQMGRLESLNPDMEVIDTSEGIDLLNGSDPHIWLSPKLVQIQAEHIYDALVEYSPENEEYFTQNYDQFIADLDELDQKLEDAFTPIEGQTILVFHPAYGYLADAYGFYQEAIENRGNEPTPAQLQEIIDEAISNNVTVIFVQAQFSADSAEAVAQAIGGAVVQIDPLAKDYFPNLETMAETIVSALG
jgi:zinc transport system substrate-binding protein